MNNDCLILVVEDDAPVRNLIITTLGTHDYSYIPAATGEQAILAASSHNPDIVLLDLGLIVISARSEDSDKIEALDAGADDYLTKPFSVEEMLARIRSTQRRLTYMRHADENQAVFVNGSLKIDYSANCVFVGDQLIHLTPIEYKLLVLLSRNVGKVLTYQFITKNVWGSSYDSEIASLRVFMASLRKKIDADNPGETCIQTHIGIGYRMIKAE